jgi:hypothetical protein
MGRGFLILLVELAATGAESGPGRGVPIPPVGLQAKQVNDEVHPPREAEESRPPPDPSGVRPFLVRPGRSRNCRIASARMIEGAVKS